MCQIHSFTSKYNLIWLKKESRYEPIHRFKLFLIIVYVPLSPICKSSSLTHTVVMKSNHSLERRI